MMNRACSVIALLAFLVALAAVVSQSSSARAQDDGRFPALDEDFGRRLRHPPAGKRGPNGWLRVPNSGKESPDPAVDGEPPRQSFRAEPKWQYRWFDHPTPSYQYFRQPRTYTWRYDSYPGLGRHLQPGYNTYYFHYYPSPYQYSYYYPPGYYWRYGSGGRYGW